MASCKTMTIYQIRLLGSTHYVSADDSETALCSIAEEHAPQYTSYRDCSVSHEHDIYDLYGDGITCSAIVSAL